MEERERRGWAEARRRHPAGKGRVTPPTYRRDMDATERHTQHDTHLEDEFVTQRGGEHPAGRDGRDRSAPPAQGRLPFDSPGEQDEVDEPIPFHLTARARRAVAPEKLPPLTVVPGSAGVPAPGEGEDGALEEPGDTRPARARALRRAGLSVPAISEQLGADELTVRAWVGDVVVHRQVRQDEARVEVAPEANDLVTGFELARAAARDEGQTRLATDASFAAGLGIAVALAEIDHHAVTATTHSLEIATRLVGWLRSHLEADPSRIRVVLRVGPAIAGDLVRHRWADGLEVPPEQVSHTRWRGAPAPGAVEALVRVADPVAAATLAGWRDALLDPQVGHGPTDIAF